MYFPPAKSQRLQRRRRTQQDSPQPFQRALNRLHSVIANLNHCSRLIDSSNHTSDHLKITIKELAPHGVQDPIQRLIGRASVALLPRRLGSLRVLG